MATGTDGGKNNGIYFPIDQTERATQTKVEHLLPHELYARIAALITAAIPGPQIPNEHSTEEFSRMRRHNAILLEGQRGVGKSTMLVNLELYLRHRQPKIETQVHVLKPVDPTQLEDKDDLFLNVIVAAILSDRDLQKAKENDENKRKDLYRSLQSLSTALEARQTEQDSAGIDQLRAFMGSQQLAVAVHDFFRAALNVLGKKLLILSLDDVDTTLYRAFENLEVVRRYLSSPLVLPIICGHLELYDEVIQREYLHRLTRDHRGGNQKARDMARELALEYERKLLPAQNRLKLPPIEDYLTNRSIKFTSDDSSSRIYSIGLAHLRDWVIAILMGPVNGLENSSLSLPIRSLRALSQLVGAMNRRISILDDALATLLANNSEFDIGRHLQMPTVRAEAMREFSIEQAKAQSRAKLDTDAAYAAFYQLSGEIGSFAPDSDLNAMARKWRQPLRDYFEYEPTAGPACLVLDASLYWRPDAPAAAGLEMMGEHSVLDTPLFMPMRQQGTKYLGFIDRNADLASWKDYLKGKLPEEAINRLPQKSIVAFPTPEAGKPLSVRNTRANFDADDKFQGADKIPMLNVVNDLMLHRGYYSSNKQAPLLLTGRLLELLITGLVRNVTSNDIHRLLASAPYHSATSVAPTKTLLVEAEEDDEFPMKPQQAGSYAGIEEGIEGLVKSINEWRIELNLASFEPSPWLIYNALNKTLNQSWYFNKTSAAAIKGFGPHDIAQVARMTFNSFLAAIGSFEKGPIFGLPRVVSTVNISTGESFQNSDLYRQNIAPFFGGTRSHFGIATRSVTRALASHPLRRLLSNLRPPSTTVDNSKPSTDKQTEDEAKKWLRQRLGSSIDSSILGATQVARLIARAELSNRELNKIARELQEKFPQNTRARIILEEGRKDIQ